ncbi:glycerol-3-phosphate dehydrogenase [Ginsengibacter hankyongi]|uniref:Glycerol-3-phosphate dehydrogenase n=1 Tax=Ginsengibacter hankyongi TaxID=2607284 RepID=A0A5J5IGM4_9BACT|nr:NAD(P)H-dependent glycerol-3-phosphate dehydrogenase [Ginsengibacter hankyongi]KAA9039325.1 glycerol-3-phosphate dehydrogenase [Ginsengibacter hankyongi]
MKFGIIGSGSWGTALAKILTDNVNSINWWIRNETSIVHFKKRHHNLQYLSSAYFDTSLLHLTTNVEEVITNSDCIIVVVPSAYALNILGGLPKNIFQNKKIVSAIKGILPEQNLLLNDYLKNEYAVELTNYFTILGPCHAEEVAAEKLSYLTFSGIDIATTELIASFFKNEYINIITNDDIYGVQYAAILKNIYALGAGIAHGLEYGDNFLSVLIANSADEMAGFLRKAGIQNIEVGSIDHTFMPIRNEKHITNYAASVYLGDLLVTCYSLYSRNRTFGNMIGKGYSVKSAQLEMNMVAEGYNASKCIHIINKKILAEIPIAETIYKILWEHLSPEDGFREIEKNLV